MQNRLFKIGDVVQTTDEYLSAFKGSKRKYGIIQHIGKKEKKYPTVHVKWKGNNATQSISTSFIEDIYNISQQGEQC